MENIPEYIEGIPTTKKVSKERVALIKSYYEKLWKQLQRTGRGNRIYNGFLGVDIFIVEKESDKKTIYAASKNWQSTFAVKHLSEVVAKAKKFGDGPIYDKPKGNTQKANGYKNIAVLHHKIKLQGHQLSLAFGERTERFRLHEGVELFLAFAQFVILFLHADHVVGRSIGRVLFHHCRQSAQIFDR